MIELLFLFIGILIGAGAIWLYFVNLNHKRLGELQQVRQKAEADLTIARQRAESDQALLRQQIATQQHAYLTLENQLKAANGDLEQLRALVVETKSNNSGLRAELEAERRAHSEEELQLRQQQERDDQKRKEQFEAQLDTVRAQFETLAAKVLDQQADRLKNQNVEAIGQLTQPLKENLRRLDEAIHTTNQETAKNTASLSQQLENMAQHSERINTTATRLANVLRGGNKIQGNWGELILTEILEQNGFKEGVNYDVQQTLTDDKGNILLGDESGRKMIPDVILHYPKNEDVIIDSKMSIEAYELWVNADNDDLRKKYAEDLTRSVRNQMMSLSKKDYSSYVRPPRRAIDFVIMFVPNEGALQVALATDKRLWNDAFDRRVFITSQQNLMAILKMIEIAWRQHYQTQNQLRVYGLAEELLKRVGEFVKRFDKVKKDIETLHRDYDDAYNKVYTGRQSVVQKANELKQLGVKESTNQPIPAAEDEVLLD